MWKASIGYNDSWSQVDPEVLEKFAELIVKECCETVATTEIEGNNNAMLRGEIATRLTKHFGVAE
jgi:hypothetical protein